MRRRLLGGRWHPGTLHHPIESDTDSGSLDTQLLRSLEREVGPAADAAVPSRPAARSALSRAALRTCLAAAALSGFVMGWLYSNLQSPIDVGTAGLSTARESNEVLLLREALSNAKVDAERLRNDLQRGQRKTPQVWFEDTLALNYRSPRPQR